MFILKKQKLKDLYERGFSMKEIADNIDCSSQKVAYWMNKFNIPRRTRSNATYVKRNPNGDPFKIINPQNLKDAELKGYGLGLYWGEGTKKRSKLG